MLALLDSSEQNLYYIHRELASLAGATTVVPVLGSVADERSVRDFFRALPSAHSCTMPRRSSMSLWAK